MRFLLLPFSWLYGLVMFCRNKAFDLGVLRSESVGVPVISVGNMTMGGTGKTPLVEYTVQRCLF
ncbi:MAG: tetraacyldisaccharide 4'-kinase, partial [Bacteroidota bacterium]